MEAEKTQQLAAMELAEVATEVGRKQQPAATPMEEVATEAEKTQQLAARARAEVATEVGRKQ